MRKPAARARQRWWLGAMVAVVLVAVSFKPKAQPAPAGDDALVLTADQALGAAMRAGDQYAARHLLSLEFDYVDEMGALHARRPFLDDLKALAAEPAADVAERIYGRLAMVTGHRRSAHGSDVFFLDIWVKQKGAWRALVAQDVRLGVAEASAAALTAADWPAMRDPAKVFDCKNPCETIPYRVRSPAEQDIVTTFQAIAKATAAHDADEYAKHMADEFVHYETRLPPVPKTERIAAIEEKQRENIPAIITAIQSMRLWVYGDGAAMISTNGVADDTEPLLRVARVWTRRSGQWQMVISVQTAVEK